MLNVKKTIVVLLLPILLFYVLLIPYSVLNREIIVDWLGCGCPQTDEYGNIVEPVFNANDFTLCFWSFISVCVAVISFFLSGRMLKEHRILRIFYMIGIIVLSLFITYNFCQMMMWN